MSCYLSLFDIFKIGIGPSSSHTVGPMRAGLLFARRLEKAGHLAATQEVTVRLYGSLALTGRGHATDRAVRLGLLGYDPAEINPDEVEPAEQRIVDTGMLNLLGKHPVPFNSQTHILFLGQERLPRHTNGMLISAFDGEGVLLDAEEYYSIGGGFVIEGRKAPMKCASGSTDVPYPFGNADELLALCRKEKRYLPDLMWDNECALRPAAEVRKGIRHIWNVMEECVRRGFSQPEGELPGGLHVQRRAPAVYKRLRGSNEESGLAVMDWIDAWAFAVGEENAAGGRVVTAPTNGAAGIVPAVLHYYMRFEPTADEAGLIRFFTTSAAIGSIYKNNASISGAEMGCQGEVGVACSMAAGGLAAALKASNAQIENAAEIGMEHNLGLTCDPVKGLVQIPCIERNTMGAVKAINAARLAMAGNGTHRVSLDQAVATMYQTGKDMSEIYRETSMGGLAVNVSEC